MAIHSDNEILNFRERWRDREDLVAEVISILKGNRKADNHEQIARRVNQANQLLRQNDFPPVEIEKTVYIGIKNSPVKTAIYIPGLDLRGVPLDLTKDLSGIVLTGSHLEGIHIESTNLDCAHLESANLDRAEIHYSSMQYSNFTEASLNGIVCHSVDLQYATMRGTKLLGSIVVDSKLEGSDFSYCIFGEISIVSSDPRLIATEDGRLVPKKQKRITTFARCSYLPLWRDHFITKQYHIDLENIEKGKLDEVQKKKYRIEIRRENFQKHIKNRWFYTLFEKVRIDDADTTLALDLKRYVQDQQYLYRFKQTHPYIYWFWKFFSDCGGKLSVVFFWSLVFIGLFALLYGLIPSQPINPEPFFRYSENLPAFWKWIYVSFDIFSNLGIRSTYPNNPLGVILMICESIFGFMMLGMLISVLANRFARRS